MTDDKLAKRVKEWDEYFSIHCHLPASAMLDLFAYIEKLEVENERLREHLSHVLRCRDDYGCSLCDDAHEALENNND